MAAPKIMLIRHAEKPNGSGDTLAVSLDGRADRRELSVRGWQRAGALLTLFGPRVLADPRLPRPSAIFACAPDAKSARSYRTVQLLGEALGLDVNIAFGNGEESKVVDVISRLAGPVLVAWKQEGLPRLAAQLLGDAAAAPRTWPKDRYDLVWLLDQPEGAAAWRFSQIPQRLLPGDSEALISGL